MPLKIGLVTGEFPPMEGGVGAYCQVLGRALAEHGHDIHIITDRRAFPGTGRGNWRDLREAVDLGYGSLHARVRHWRWPSLSLIADIAKRYELDVVNVQYQAAAYDLRSPAINWLPWRLKGMAKNVVTFHDLRVPYLFPKAGRLREAAVTFMARQAHGVIVTNPDDFQAMRCRLGLDAPLVEIPIGSNIPTCEAAGDEAEAARARLGLPPSARLLAYFGFVSESKGADTLIEALALLDAGVHLVFIGGETGHSDGGANLPFLDRVKKRIGEQGLDGRVHWTGFILESDVSSYLHGADLVVLPYQDGASLRRGTLMAALAHGRPIVTSFPESPISVLVDGENIAYTPPGNAAALANAIGMLLDDERARGTLAKGAARAAESFSWDKIAARTGEFYARLYDAGDSSA